MKISFTLGEIKIENINITIDVPDEIFNMNDFKEILTVSSGEPKRDNKTNPMFKSSTAPQKPVIPKDEFHEFNKIINEFMAKHHFVKTGVLYQYVDGDICVHISQSHFSTMLYVYNKCDRQIYYSMERNMTISRHNNNYVENDVVKKLVGIFKKHAKSVKDVY